VKVLIIQLARLGDIFQTWPTFRALSRAGAEVHVLVRPRFLAATEGCAAIRKTHQFQTEEILGPVLSHGANGLVPSMSALDQLLNSLASERFDRIVNLSFSPLASWITFDLELRAFAEGRAVTSVGYTRHADGTLAIPDDGSAFFFAQVGPRSTSFPTQAVNRISLPRLFASITQSVVPQLTLCDTDWSGPDIPIAAKEEFLPASAPDGFFAVHIGASESQKTLDAHGWSTIIARVIRETGKPVMLLGSVEEGPKGQDIELELRQRYALSPTQIVNNVGRTKIEDVFALLKRARLLIAGDSALIHMASLLGLRVLNLSSRTVSHWETGPQSLGSRIIIYGNAGPDVEVIVHEAVAMMRAPAEDSQPNVFSEGALADRVVQGPLEALVDQTSDAQADFLWSFVSGLYLGTKFHVPQDAKLMAAIQNWRETAEIEAQQLTAIKKATDLKVLASILERVDELTALIIDSEPRLAPLYRWLNTERSRVGPQTREEIADRYLKINEQLTTVLNNLYSVGAINDRHELEL
jgi:heptosyltransferase-3